MNYVEDRKQRDFEKHCMQGKVPNYTIVKNFRYARRIYVNLRNKAPHLRVSIIEKEDGNSYKVRVTTREQ